MKKLGKFIFLIWFLILNSYFAFADEDLKLIFALDLVRHGDRAPTRYIPKISDAWTKEETGKLTSLGEKQAELLGKKFKNYYINRTYLLPRNFRPSLIYVNTTDFQRTKKTAKLILKGIYPDDYEKIQIDILPKKQDILNPIRHKKRRAAITKQMLKDDNVLSKKLVSSIKEQLENINNIFGTSFSRVRDLGKIGDLFWVNKIHNKPLLKPFSKQSKEKVFSLLDELILSSFAYPQISCLYGKDFVLHVANLLQTKNYKQKYLLYVAHDANILAIMPLLNFKLKTLPPYLSDLRFEVFQNKNNNNLFVRTSFNGEIIKICKSSDVCPLRKFVGILEDNIQNKCNVPA